MHSAPAVTHPTGRTARLALLLASLGALGLAGAIGVAVSGGAQPRAAWQAGALLAACAVALGALWRFWHAQRPRQLAWDGAQWRLQDGSAPAVPDGAVVQVQVRLDLQAMLLLCAQDLETGRHVWLWAQKGADADRWHLLRCAVWAMPPRPQGAAADATPV
ncbi:hypothetical protein [Ottowia sp.]|uniref:hypothetical protein n=1 Tax=Ottowia sp. TaxID=1898956 RepID=UPI002B64ECCA|nr:hypothetical protein [Pseudomonadota bacterium]HOV18386.1 hypothetical protein [Ottowia sp.]